MLTIITQVSNKHFVMLTLITKYIKLNLLTLTLQNYTGTLKMIQSFKFYRSHRH